MDGKFIGLAAVILIFGVIPVTAMYVLLKLRARQMETLVKLVEHGAAVDAETIRLMGSGSSSYKTDYRWGVFWVALGIPVTIGLWVEAGLGTAVWALIPIFIGLGFIASGFFRLRESDDDDRPPD